MQTQLRDAELALKWAASLPDLAFVIATAIAFKAAARAAGDRKFFARFGLTLWFAVIVAALPALASAADSQAMLDYAELGFVLLWLWLIRSEEHTSELQSLMRISYAVFCLKKKKTNLYHHHNNNLNT